MARRVVKMTDVSGAPRVPPADDWDPLVRGLRVVYGSRRWTVMAVDPRANRVILED